MRTRRAMGSPSYSLVRNREGVCAVLIALISVAVGADEDKDAIDPALRLGKRLFVEKRFADPASNVAGSCDSCHRPEWAPEGRRAYADSERYSLMPTRFGGSAKRTTLRNAPSLMDVTGHARFNHDGRFAALEDAIAAELTSPHIGWSPGERESALDEIHWVLLGDAAVDQNAAGTYLEQFKHAYGIDLETMTREKAVGWVVKCLAEYVTSLKSTRTSAFDAFVDMNGLPPRPEKGESMEVFGESLLARVASLEARTALKLHTGFSREAYAGFKVFMRTTGKARTGNCVACHFPPLFTDGAFHNTGIAQAEYDAVHGGGSFAQLAVPNAADARRPVEKFGPKTERGQQVNADLGYWNFVQRPEAALKRKEGGSFLAAAFGAFKTPTLRNLEYTDPYMHNGAYGTLAEAVAQKVKACALARSGVLLNGDEALSVMNITEVDITPLVAFLTTLNDLPVEEFDSRR